MPCIKFDYKRFPYKPNEAFPDKHFTTQPVIPIALINGEKRIDIYGLVDSGAYTNLLNPAFCEPLGIDLTCGKKHFAFGIGGGRQTTYFHSIEIEIGGYKFPCYGGFTEGFGSD